MCMSWCPDAIALQAVMYRNQSVLLVGLKLPHFLCVHSPTLILLSWRKLSKSRVPTRSGKPLEIWEDLLQSGKFFQAKVGTLKKLFLLAQVNAPKHCLWPRMWEGGMQKQTGFSQASLMLRVKRCSLPVFREKAPKTVISFSFVWHLKATGGPSSFYRAILFPISSRGKWLVSQHGGFGLWPLKLRSCVSVMFLLGCQHNPGNCQYGEEFDRDHAR